MLKAAAIIDVSNKNILVIRTVEPWLEAVLFSRYDKEYIRKYLIFALERGQEGGDSRIWKLCQSFSKS